MPLADGDGATLVVPGLHKWLWEKRIHEFEHVPRLLASITGDTAERLAAIRQRWVAAALERLEGLGIGSPQQRFAPPRWISEEHRRRGERPGAVCV